MERKNVEAAIRSAFAGVRLGAGTSLQQARLIDEGLTLDTSQAEFASILRHETTDDWTQIAEAELLCDALAHLDADGLRYYLPALMLWLLDHYNDEGLIFDPDASMTAIATMSALTSGRDSVRSDAAHTTASQGSSEPQSLSTSLRYPDWSSLIGRIPVLCSGLLTAIGRDSCRRHSPGGRWRSPRIASCHADLDAEPCQMSAWRTLGRVRGRGTPVWSGLLAATG